MRCPRCQESCEAQGHLRGGERTPDRLRAVRLAIYGCLRCDATLLEQLCDCCDNVVVPLRAASKDELRKLGLHTSAAAAPPEVPE
jgi:hypothetical protein